MGRWAGRWSGRSLQTCLSSSLQALMCMHWPQRQQNQTVLCEKPTAAPAAAPPARSSLASPCLQTAMLAAGDWGGWLGVQSTLLFWQKWLMESLKYSAPDAWPSVARRFYATADPLASAVAVALLVASLCFLLSLPTNNHSFVSVPGRP